MSIPLRDNLRNDTTNPAHPQSVHSEMTALDSYPQTVMAPLGSSSSPGAIKGKSTDIEQGVSVGPARTDGKVVDAVWGEIDGDGPGYRTLSW